MQQPVRVIGAPGNENIQTATVELWSDRKRIGDASKLLGACWAISALTILVPVIHVLLVPLFFLGGIGGAYWRWSQKGVFRAEGVRCPQCGAAVDLNGVLFQLPIYRACPGCSQNLFIEQAPPA